MSGPDAHKAAIPAYLGDARNRERLERIVADFASCGIQPTRLNILAAATGAGLSAESAEIVAEIITQHLEEAAHA